MPRILLRSICKKRLSSMPFIIWVFMGIAFESIGNPLPGFGIQIVIVLFISVFAGGIQLPDTMFIMPFSRKQRENYLKRLRLIILGAVAFICAAAGTILVICQISTIPGVVNMCITGVSVTYVLSYSDYFMAKDSAMAGAQVFFALVNIGLFAACDAGRFSNNAVTWGVMAGSVITFIIELAVFERYTEDMIHMLSDYEASVYMDKKLKRKTGK